MDKIKLELELNYALDRYNEEYADLSDYNYLAEKVEEVFNTSIEAYAIVDAGGNWRGLTGYKLVTNLDNALDTIFNSASINNAKIQKGKKVIEFSASNHDAPCGFKYYLIGLTDNQYSKVYESYNAINYLQKFIKRGENK